VVVKTSRRERMAVVARVQELDNNDSAFKSSIAFAI
jgi:hypothetical protein